MNPIELSGLVTKGTRSAWALTSPDDRYRYALGRCWCTQEEDGDRPMMFITMMNPSKARHDESDPTLDKVVHFAKAHGCRGVLVRNLAAYSSKDPRDLGRVGDPVGPENLRVLDIDALFAKRVAAWGNFPSRRVYERLKGTIVLLKQFYWGGLHVFGVNGTGEPKHPLYLPHATRLVRWADVKVA